LEHRTRIERAKGMLMVREGLDDAAAFERLRSTARSSRRPLIDVVNEVLSGQRLSRPRRWSRLGDRSAVGSTSRPSRGGNHQVRPTC
jgi:hypothetical protein